MSVRKCDICAEIRIITPAIYDAKIPSHGMWADLCEEHFKLLGWPTRTRERIEAEPHK